MSQPTARVLAVLELLQAHGRMSGTEIARRLEVDVRTVRRYITALETLGIPLTAERGRHGAYALVRGYKLPPMMFTNEETLSISLGLLAARALGLAAATPAFESVQAKLERVMPADLKRRARAISETATLDLVRSGGTHDNAVLLALTHAAQDRRRVRLRYRAFDETRSEREFDIYGLVYRDGYWYASGFCHLRNDLRSFRVDRIEAVEMRDATFNRPEGFDAGAFVAEAFARIPRSTEVVVFVRANAQDVMAVLWRDIGVFEPHADGVLLRAHTDHIDWFARQLARLPFAFEIRSPDALHAALRAHAGRLLEMHATA